VTAPAAFWVGEDGARACRTCAATGRATTTDEAFADAVTHYTATHDTEPLTEENPCSTPRT
jgi:hypothetical protein